MSVLSCAITTPERLVFEGEALSVVVPAVDGEMGFLSRHAPLVGTLGSGELRVRSLDETTARYFVSQGFVQVNQNKVTVLASEAIPFSELSVETEEVSLHSIEQARPPASSGLEQRGVHEEKLKVARARLRSARRAAGS